MTTQSSTPSGNEPRIEPGSWTAADAPPSSQPPGAMPPADEPGAGPPGGDQEPGRAGPVGPTGPRIPPWSGDKQLFDPRVKSPFWAAALSVVPGLGMIYIGYYSRAVLQASAVLTLAFMTALSRGDLGPVLAFGTLFAWLFNVVDSGRLAALYNHSMAGYERIEMPPNFRLPAMDGSIVGGTILVVFSVVALSNTLLGLSLDWLEEWWPVFPLGLGAYLLWRGIQDHTKAREAMARRDAVPAD